jgi:coenzyme F420-reducing hydrogenase alpha subunit
VTHRGSRILHVGSLSRVEGEGALSLHVHDGTVTEARLEIYEPPRFFEAFLRGRAFTEPVDITARICGICPVAYQTSACWAVERACGVTVPEEVRAMRRLLYCGEWIQSHALHVFMLHAPDFLGYPSALAMAADHREIVEQGLAIKKVGNQLISAIGGRPIHPVSVRVGGFSRAPRKADLEAVRHALDAAVAHARATVRLVASWTPPELDNPQPLVAMRHPDEYPFNDGRIVSTAGLDLAPQAWGTRFEELHLEGTNALHARTLDGEVYLLSLDGSIDRLDPA